MRVSSATTFFIRILATGLFALTTDICLAGAHLTYGQIQHTVKPKGSDQEFVFSGRMGQLGILGTAYSKEKDPAYIRLYLHGGELQNRFKNDDDPESSETLTYYGLGAGVSIPIPSIPIVEFGFDMDYRRMELKRQDEDLTINQKYSNGWAVHLGSALAPRLGPVVTALKFDLGAGSYREGKDLDDEQKILREVTFLGSQLALELRFVW